MVRRGAVLHARSADDDVAPGYDHITSAIGAAMIGLMRHRDAVLRHAERASRAAEQGRCEGGRDCADRGAHAADLAKGHPRAQAWDDALSKARFEFRWQDQFNLAMDPVTARAYR